MRLFRFIRNQLNHDSAIRIQIDALNDEIQKIARDRRTEYLIDRNLHDKTMGISQSLIKGEEFIVSLTTHGRRINDAYLAIESIMQGSMKPNRIILWLSRDEFGHTELPLALQNQIRRGLQIELCDNLLSYKKIVPSILKYPDSNIITIDDDAIYDFDLVERLVSTHFSNKNDICACRTHRMTFDSNGRLKSYLQWQFEADFHDKSNLTFLTGGAGALYPAHCFCPQFFDSKLFMSICPTADDVWINIMIWLSNRHISKVYTRSANGCDYIQTSNTYDALQVINNNATECRNDIQIKALMAHFGLSVNRAGVILHND